MKRSFPSAHGAHLILTIVISSLCMQAQADVSSPLQKRLRDRVQVGSHRGGGLSGQGNTLIQFKKAFADGADIIETDLRLTKDGIVVVYHDEQLSKATNCRGRVKDYVLTKLRECRFKTNSEIIPTFEETLQWSVGRVVVNAEFKDASTIEPAIKLMRAYDALEWVYFQTQEHKSNYERARKADKQAYLIYYAIKMADLRWALSIQDPALFMIDLDPRLHDPKILALIKAAGKLTSANSFQVSLDEENSGAASCDVLLRFGFDILITDQTQDCVRQRNRH
ncbi:MAG: glycerophosphodiester phosphodiesterase family protein [Bdellovibrionota bacterium]